LKYAEILFSDRTNPLFYLFKTLARNYFSRLEVELGELEIDRYYFILFLIIRKGHITQQALCNMLNIDKASMVRIVDYLGKKGYANRIVNPDDRRSYVIVPTRAAIAAYKLIDTAFSSINALCLHGFSQKEISTLYHMLERININLGPATEIHTKINTPE
jgi:DNA-binding MarR family transcriptional regulator